MFHRKTLFILGAGASAEIGLPVGGGLASVIASKMDVRFEMGHRPIGTGDFDLYSRICAVHDQETSEYLKQLGSFVTASILPVPSTTSSTCIVPIHL